MSAYEADVIRKTFCVEILVLVRQTHPIVTRMSLDDVVGWAPSPNSLLKQMAKKSR